MRADTSVSLSFKPHLLMLHIQTVQLYLYLYIYLSLDSERGNLWDLLALDWLQKKAECLRFCIGRWVTPTGQLPVSVDIEYEFSSRNPYNFLQVTYYKASSFTRLGHDPYGSFLFNYTLLFLLISWKSFKKQHQQLTLSSSRTPVTWR